MKISKRQLKQMIKEELENILSEDDSDKIKNIPKDRVTKDVKAFGKEMPKLENGDIDWIEADKMAAEYRLANPGSRLAKQ